MGIDVVFNGELEALKKPGNIMVPLKEISRKSNSNVESGKTVKKGGRK
jgi:hypothetical protein